METHERFGQPTQQQPRGPDYAIRRLEEWRGQGSGRVWAVYSPQATNPTYQVDIVDEHGDQFGRAGQNLPNVVDNMLGYHADRPPHRGDDGDDDPPY